MTFRYISVVRESAVDSSACMFLFSTLWRLLLWFRKYPLLLVTWIDHISWPLCVTSQMYSLCSNHLSGIYWSIAAFWKLHVHSLIFIYQACHPPTSKTILMLDVFCLVFQTYIQDQFMTLMWEAACRILLNFITLLFMYFNKVAQHFLDYLNFC